MTFIISSVRATGTITYHCSTPATALAKVEDFRRSDYRDISIAVTDANTISERELASLAGQIRLAA